jgi:hypothetical protein
MGRNNENTRLALQLAKRLTKKQLIKWNVKYDELIFGKLSDDILIDDKFLGKFKKLQFRWKRTSNIAFIDCWLSKIRT